jgi:hypothetical protein
LARLGLFPNDWTGAMLEFRSAGRRVSEEQFFENFKNDAIEAGMKELERRPPHKPLSRFRPGT